MVDEQKEVEAFLDDQLSKGYIQASNSQQTSLVFFVPKKDGKKCMVQDYCYLNEWTNKNNYPLPLISQLVDKLKGCNLFIYSCLEGPCVGRFAQVCLDECMAANAWPTWAALQTEIENFFLPGNNKEWARSQLLRLCQGPCQRIDDFLAQFQALKLQSECPNEYAKDLLKRAVSRRILEQVYMQGHARETWEQVTAEQLEEPRSSS